MAKATHFYTTDNPVDIREDLSIDDLKLALKKGLEDFSEWPTHIVLAAILYPIVGILIARIIIGYDVLPLLFPVSAGFALIAPAAALGLAARTAPSAARAALGLAIVLGVLSGFLLLFLVLHSASNPINPSHASPEARHLLLLNRGDILS